MRCLRILPKESKGKDLTLKHIKKEKGIKDGIVLLISDKVKKPIAARYNFSNTANASIFSTAGLPASSFRTDNWEK